MKVTVDITSPYPYKIGDIVIFYLKLHEEDILKTPTLGIIDSIEFHNSTGNQYELFYTIKYVDQDGSFSYVSGEPNYLQEGVIDLKSIKLLLKDLDEKVKEDDDNSKCNSCKFKRVETLFNVLFWWNKLGFTKDNFTKDNPAYGKVISISKYSDGTEYAKVIYPSITDNGDIHWVRIDDIFMGNIIKIEDYSSTKTIETIKRFNSNIDPTRLFSFNKEVSFFDQNNQLHVGDITGVFRPIEGDDITYEVTAKLSNEKYYVTIKDVFPYVL